MRRGWLVILVLCACNPSPKAHCEARQAFWEQGFGENDPAFTQRSRPLFVESCTQMLSQPEYAAELKCRSACLEAANPGLPRSRSEVRAAHLAFSTCEERCMAPGALPTR